jgi:chemotaxis protein MotB
MMIFFLSLWLLSMASNTGKAVFSEYFRKGSPMEGGGSSIIKLQFLFEQEMKQRKDAIKKVIEEKTVSLSDNMAVEVLDNGVRIQMMDSKENSLFESGSAKPTATATALFKTIASAISGLPNKIRIEGHTDAVPYHNGEISNWELSTMRASAARIELEKNGIPAFKIDRIVGYADTRPLIKDNPADMRNRRISIFVAFEKMKMD